MITGSVTAAQNLVKCVNRAGFEIQSVMFSSLAAAEAVLSSDEKELGAIVIDIGGGTTNVLVYLEGAPFFSAVLPVGGQQVTGDLSIMLKTAHDSAEQIKQSAGCAYLPLVEEGEPIIVPGVGGRPPVERSRRQVCEIIQPRMAEILGMVRDRVVRRQVLERIAGGVVLTGGGALLPGVVELAQDVFNLGGRIGQPGSHGGLVDRYQSPEYATAVGLVLHQDRMLPGGRPGRREKRSGAGRGIRKWVRNFFE
jgi:cell division protein FtsA